MIAKVDVKSFFQDLICFLEHRDDLAGFEIKQTEEVSAAVAELIEAAKRLEKRGFFDDVPYSPDVDLAAMKAALARIGSAS